MRRLKDFDPEISQVLKDELGRQQNKIVHAAGTCGGYCGIFDWRRRKFERVGYQYFQVEKRKNLCDGLNTGYEYR